jgi:FtsP/CotA-like multicopper oxidase with cupredoxin domain
MTKRPPPARTRGPLLTRRTLLRGSLATLVAVGAAAATGGALAAGVPRVRPPAGRGAALGPPPPFAPPARGTLPIPPLAIPEDRDGVRVFALTLQPGRSSFWPGVATATCGINGAYLGPTIRAQRGDTLQLDVANQLGEATTLHWHGLHFPAAMDGGPHQVIPDGVTWSPRFTIKQEAATLWYHPHMLGQTAAQVGRGLAGLLLIDDDNPVQALLPHTYGVDDIPLVLQDAAFDPQGQFDPTNSAGSRWATLVNGAMAPTLATDQPRLRLRLLNASSDSIFTLGFADARTFTQVASDGGLLPRPVPLTSAVLGPGERAEFVVDLADGQPALLQRLPDDPAGAGVPAMTLLAIAPAATRAPLAPLPTALNVIPRLPPALATTTRDMVLGNITINGQSMMSMADMPVPLRVRLGDIELWNLINTANETPCSIFTTWPTRSSIATASPRPRPNAAGRTRPWSTRSRPCALSCASPTSPTRSAPTCTTATSSRTRTRV